MKTIFRNITAIAILFATGISAMAQSANDFFLDNYAFKYRFNPATPSEKSFVAIGLGSVDFGFGTNVGLSSFVFPTDDGLVTGFNSAVPADKFLGGLPKTASFSTDFSENILAVGSWAKKGFTSLEINLRGDASFGLPKGFFEFAKLGSSSSTYDLSSLDMNANAYLEIAFGRAKQLTERLNFGLRIKGLIGLTSIYAGADKFTLKMNSEMVQANADASMRVALKGAQIPLDENANFDFENFDPDTNVNYDDAGASGFGLGIDVGATYKLGNLTFSAAITDLGLMRWNYNIVGVAQSSMEFKGVNDIDMSSSDNLGDAFTEAFKELGDIAQLGPAASEAKMTKLNWGANAGVKYHPFNILSVGAVAMLHNTMAGTSFEAHAGATLSPLKFLSIEGNVGTGTFGSTFGAAASLTVLGINAYVAADSYLGSVTPSGVPVNPFRTNVKSGLLITFGKRHMELR